LTLIFFIILFFWILLVNGYIVYKYNKYISNKLKNDFIIILTHNKLFMSKINSSKTKKNNRKQQKQGKLQNKKTAKMTGYDAVINVQNPWFTLIKEGRKTIEGRLNKGRFASLKVGQVIMWENAGQAVKTKLVRIEKYNTFSDMLANEGLRHVLPDIKTIKDGVDVYRQFYSEAKEAEYGVLAIQVELI
jgi:ASC-1-like (ASCH) protein